MRIYELKNLPESEFCNAGGKAKGLYKLISAGLSVAKGFVIIGLETSDDYAAAAKYYTDNGYGNVAVRSSATAEDGADFSAAGQYETFLNVCGENAFADALEKCMASLKSETAESYSSFFSDAKSKSMSIVVQEMVDAGRAGVAFTADPVSGEKAILIEAVFGIGEALVSGHAKSESCRVPTAVENGKTVIDSDKIAGGKILSLSDILQIADDSLTAKAYFGEELDLEWAMDKSGKLIWLQARPITTLDDSDIGELDCTDFADTIVFTNCNIGEMLPGAVTPLSLSTSVASIDTGLRRMLVAAGAYKKGELKPRDCIVSFSNHLFFNLTTVYKMAVTIIGAAKPDVEASICGKQLDTPDLPWKNARTPRRLINAIKYFKFLFSRNKAKKKINKTVDKLVIQYSADPAGYYNNIDKSLYLLDDATWYHYIASAHSGAMSSILLRILSESFETDEEVRGLLAALLEDIDGIESVDILRSMRRLAREVIVARPDARDMDWQQLAGFIDKDNSEVKAAYDSFMKRHGHRAIREAELRSKSWEMDRQGFAENLLTVIKTGAAEPEKSESKIDESIAKALNGKKGILKIVIKYIIGQSRAGVYNREYTKARFVRAVDRIKKAYIRLAKDLVAAGALPDEDLIYFLTHEELGDLIHNRSSKYIKLALKRRRLLAEQAQVKYKDVYVGKPEPITLDDTVAENGTVLSGAPISRGEVKGRARVVRCVDDARKLSDGEIMIAAFTDIGWSPYYSVIGGLVTEVGSALSHGAVVAREYALPLVVNVNNATNIIKTGDFISLNGSKGTVTILETAAEAMTA